MRIATLGWSIPGGTTHYIATLGWVAGQPTPLEAITLRLDHLARTLQIDHEKPTLRIDHETRTLRVY